MGKRSLDVIDSTMFNSCFLILTEDCNLRCKYCYENASRCCESYMTFDIAEKAVDFLINNALKYEIRNLYITFFGGEPLLNIDVMRKTLFYAVDSANRHDIEIVFSLITNGTIYNNEFEEFISDWYRLTKKVNIQLSVDGVPEVQDSSRVFTNGELSSKIVENNIIKIKAYMEKNNIDFRNSIHTHSVITKEQISKIFPSYKYFRKIGINHVEFMMSYNEDWEEKDIPDYIEQLSLIADYVFDECIGKCSLIPYENANLIIGLKAPVKIRNSKYAAGGLRECTIIPNGDIYSYSTLYFYNGNFKLGNVFEGITDISSSRKTFVEACQSNSSNSNACFNCGKPLCNKYMTSTRLKYDEARKFFAIEIKKRFNELYNKLYYKKCNECGFLSAKY